MNATPVILLVNGPNLGRLGARKPEIYGRTTLAELASSLTLEAQGLGFRLDAFQSNAEGAIIDFLEARFDAVGLILNPGALMMCGWSLRDAVEEFPGIKIEVHLSNISAREPFRTQSVLSPVVDGVIAGLGVDSYRLAMMCVAERARRLQR